MMKTIGIEPVIASVIIVMIITGIGSGPFLSIVVITYGQRSNTNSSAVIESTAPKKNTSCALDTWLSIRRSNMAMDNKWQDNNYKRSI